MSSLTHPVGPERSDVYWRRRVSALVVLAVLVAVVVFALSRVGGDDASASASASAPGQGQDPAAAPVQDDARSTTSPDAEPATEPCAPEQLQVVATADAGSYAAETTPQLGVSVRNTGAVSCSVDLGAEAVELLVVSGEDRIWSSQDCPDGAATSVVTVDAQGEQAVATGWTRQRSAPGCPGDLAEPRPGTYQLTASAAGTTSSPLSFGLE